MLKKKQIKWLTNRLIFSIIVLVCCNSLVVYAANKPILVIKHWQTSNGLPVYFVRTPNLPMLDVRMIFTAGSVYDNENWGLASLTNNSLNQGTSKLTNKQISSEFEKVGAQYSTKVTKDMATVSLRTLTNPDYLKVAIKTFNQVITDPRFSIQSIDLIKRTTSAGIKYKEQNPKNVAQDQFFDMVFNKSAYSHPISGNLLTVSTLNSDLVKQFYHKYYVINNARLVLVGDITRQQANNISNSISTGLPVGKSAGKVDVPSLSFVSSESNKQITFPSNQASIYVGYQGMTRESPYYFPFFVGNQILGGGSMTSLLFENVRNKQGLTYGVYSVVDPLKYAGSFYISLNTKRQSCEKALSAVKHTFSEFALKGPTKQQLTMVKDYLVNSFPLGLSSNQKIINVLTNIVFYGRPLDFLDTYRQRIEAVTDLQVKQVFDQLSKKHLFVVMVGKNQS